MFIQEGNKVPVTVGSGETPAVGEIWSRLQLFGMVQEAGVEDDVITIQRGGVRQIAKTTGTAWAQGQAIFWDATNNKGITTDETGIFVGVAFENAASGDTTGKIILANPKQYHESFSTQTLVLGTVTVTDARVSATSMIFAQWKTSTGTHTTPLMCTPDSGTYTITAILVAGSTVDNACAGTVSVHVVY